jgi:beta-glucanase (GH16 family)
MRKIIFGFGLVCLALSPGCHFITKDKEADIPVTGYKLVWADEFDGDTLDKNKWDYRSLGPRRDAVNVKDAVSLDDDGHLVITTKRCKDKFHTGMIGTNGKYETTYGYFECRVKLQKAVGHWSAFWLQTPTMGKIVGDTAVSGTEIDIFEYLPNKGDSVVHNLHWDGYGKTHKTTGSSASVPRAVQEWHTFGLLWTASEYVFFVDGKETWRTNKAISQRPQYIILSLEVGKWAGDISQAPLPDSLLVDYVRVYQNN